MVRPPSASELKSVWRTAALIVAVLIFLSPWLAPRPPSYLLLTILLAGLSGVLVFTWERVEPVPAQPRARQPRFQLLVGVLCAIVLIYAAERWVGAMIWNGYRADMLIVIREATRRFLSGQNPYFTYRQTYDAPWDIVLPYGPALWGPYLIPQLLHIDLRVLTIVGELFIPVWCAIAATIEAGRGRIFAAAAWGVLLAALVASLDFPGYTFMGHTAVYWPLLPMFSAVLTRRRWVVSAFALSVLIVARSTMVVLAPLLLMTIRVQDRSRTMAAAAVMTATVLAFLLPFIVWDYGALWGSMVASYPRIIKQVVWTANDGGVTNTIGLTGWLLSHHREQLVEISQVVVMVLVYGLAWRGIHRGGRPLPWMALALLAFSMTSIWPVYYIYYDVLLLFVCASMLETIGDRIVAQRWLTSLGATVAAVAFVMGVMLQPHPDIAVGSPVTQQALQAGFSSVEQEGGRQFAWIVGDRATVALPRSSVSAARLIIDWQSITPPGSQPQVVVVVLNGKPLWTTRVPDGWQQVSFVAPSSAWWIGFNRLELQVPSPASLRGIGAGDDRRRFGLAISRIQVVPR